MSFILNTLAFRKRQGIEVKAEGHWLSGGSLLQSTLEKGVPFPCRWKKGDVCWKYVYCPDEKELETLEERVQDGEAGLSHTNDSLATEHTASCKAVHFLWLQVLA